MKHHKLFWQSSYDRGLDILLLMWKDIRQAYPDTTLDICYGWDLYDIAARNNKERQAWKQDIQSLMKQPGITHHGRVGQKKLRELRQQCGILAYPTYFTEIFCIGVVEAQNDGLVPVTMTLGALKETASKGVLIDKDIYTKEGQEEFKEKLIKTMGDKKEWKRLSGKCQKFARKFSWDSKSKDWVSKFEQKDINGKISIYTPTIRDGWFNIMCSNLSEQTHKNFEWIIVDAQEKSRQSIADKYSKMYNLDIKYVHQPKTKRTYSLSNANNLAIDLASGELFVFLQDFVLINPTALEELLNVSRKHPGDFISPVDITFAPKVKPNLNNKEDWFEGELDVVGKFIRKNIRVQKKGLRKSESLTDFEQNFGAVPLSTLKHLNGYWEFYDEALGWDDTEIIYRAKALGYNNWIDDTNQCVAIDHDLVLGESRKTSGHDNTPRYVWMVDQIKKGNLPIIRDKKIEKGISLKYKGEFSRDRLDEIVKEWGDV